MMDLNFAIWATSGILAFFLLNPSNDGKKQTHFSPQTPAEDGDESKFGHAAEKNIVFSPHQASDATVGECNRKARPDRYSFVKWTCWVIDYAFIFLLFGSFNSIFSGENFTPRAAIIMNIIIPMFTLLVDLLKAFMFSDVVSIHKLDHIKFLGKEITEIFTTKLGTRKLVKFLGCVASGEGLWKDFSAGSKQRRSVLHHIFYFVKVGLVITPAAFWLNTKLGLHHFAPLESTAKVWWEGTPFEMKVSTLLVAYAEFIFLSFIKDALSMQVFHQIMHNQWYGLHKTHHLPMKELSFINVFFFDVPDLVIENLVAPLLLLLIKCTTCDTCGGTPQIHILAVLLLLISDGNLHGICPYTVTFFNPLLDTIMKPNISHHLHHALNVGHYTVWPWHQIKGVSAAKNRASSDSTVEDDINAYNKVFNTNFPPNL